VASGEESETPFLDPHAYMASGYSLAVSAQPESSRGIWFEFAKLINAVVRNVHTTADRLQLELPAFIPGRNETAFSALTRVYETRHQSLIRNCHASKLEFQSCQVV